MGYVEVTLVQTLHHANQQKVENYILELIIGLHHLVSMAKANHNNNNNLNVVVTRSPARIHVKPPIQEPFVPSDRSVSPPPFGMFSNAEFTQGLAQQLAGYPNNRKELSQEDKEMLHNIGSDYTARKLLPGLSKSQEFDNSRAAASNREFLKLSKSSSHSGANQLEAPLYRPRSRVKPLGVNMNRLDETESAQSLQGEHHQ